MTKKVQKMDQAGRIWLYQKGDNEFWVPVVDDFWTSERISIGIPTMQMEWQQPIYHSITHVVKRGVA